MGHPDTSLRARSKAKRRHAIQREGMRLFAEFGYEGATIAEIAEAAEVAPRTVSMYFPTKLDIAMSASSDLAGRMTGIFESDPGISFSDALDRWLIAEADAMDPELAALMHAMFEKNPALQAVSTTHLEAAKEVAGPALVAESGLSPDDPMVAIVAGAVGAAIVARLQSLYDLAHVPEKGSHEQFMRYLRAIIGAARDVD